MVVTKKRQMKKTGSILLAIAFLMQLNAQTTNQDAKKILDGAPKKVLCS